MTALTKASTTAVRHAAYTVKYARYEEAGKVLIFDGKSWTTYESGDSSIPSLSGKEIPIWTAYDDEADPMWTAAADTKKTN